MNNPCPLCGHHETQADEERTIRKGAQIVADEFIKGRRSIDALSRRENEVIDAVIDLGMSFNEVSESLSINVKTAYFHWGNALKKINNL
jgi:DNA-binding CsgD family transcriptional regulator